MINCYPVAGKQKSLDICTAFAQGCGGRVVTEPTSILYPGASFFYGIDASTLHLWKQVRSSAANEFYYCDNSYFDDARQMYFRITKNRVQHSGLGESDGKRLACLQVTFQSLRRSGEHIVLCPQSDSFMANIVGYQGSWTQDAMADLRMFSTRAHRLRLWDANKAKLANTLGEDLQGAHALVTWSSAAAVTALLAGIPAIVSPQCAAAPVAETNFACIEHPEFASLSRMRNWAGVLADNQWTLDEMRRGLAWETLHG